MAFSYKRLWKLCIDRDIKRSKLATMAGISPSTLYQLICGKYVAMSVLDKLCNALECRIEDIIEFVPEDKLVND